MMDVESWMMGEGCFESLSMTAVKDGRRKGRLVAEIGVLGGWVSRRCCLYGCGGCR